MWAQIKGLAHKCRNKEYTSFLLGLTTLLKHFPSQWKIN